MEAKKIEGFVKIDLKKLDEQLNRLWALKKDGGGDDHRKVTGTTPHEITEEHDWKIDASKITVQSQIAKGSCGSVYKGTFCGQEVAVKVFDGGVDAQMPESQKEHAFKHEVSVWHNLDHPNITKFVGAAMSTSDLKIGNQEKQPRTVSCALAEYVSGGTLESYLMKNRRSKLPFKVFIRLALDLARGLKYLHSRRIIHRDVKTENMLVDGMDHTLKIADFGVACFDPPPSVSGQIGTLRYMAPEVLNCKAYGRKCDVYSFGICLWEMYCCDTPFFNPKSISDVNAAIATQEERPIVPKRCPGPVAEIMKRCWDAEPSRRPDMGEVVAMLEDIDASSSGGRGGCCCFIRKW